MSCGPVSMSEHESDKIKGLTSLARDLLVGLPLDEILKKHTLTRSELDEKLNEIKGYNPDLYDELQRK